MKASQRKGSWVSLEDAQELNGRKTSKAEGMACAKIDLYLQWHVAVCSRGCNVLVSVFTEPSISLLICTYVYIVWMCLFSSYSRSHYL